MKLIQLTKGKQTMVDDEDFDSLSRYKWQYGGRRYAIRNTKVKDGNGKVKTKVIWLHREIMKTPNDCQTDHINGESLDNRKENLRIVSRQQNGWNSKTPSHNTSGYKGVSKRNNRWESSITLNNKKKHLGYFSSSEAAAERYNQEALFRFKEYAKLNDLPYFEYEYLPKMEDVRQNIQKCEGIHKQQCAYSTFHDALTQVCFGCRKIRSTIKR